MMAVYHHPCGKREALLPTEARKACPKCAALWPDGIDAVTIHTIGKIKAAFKPAKRYRAALANHSGGGE